MRTHIQKTKTKPMRKITREIVDAFQNSRSLTIGNSRTNGESLWLFDNKIAEIRRDGLWITNAGWDSATTKERLNGLSGVHIVQRGGNWFLNFRQWDGGWVNVDAWNQEAESVPEVNVPEPEFDVTSEWMKQGYSRPIYSIYHTLVEVNLNEVEQMLNGEGIPTKRMESDTDGIYQPNYFVVVRPEDVVRASSILCESYCIV
jgi:hypothetical protein